MISLRILTILFILSSGAIGLAQPRVIFDTDIGSDCDDAGAMAVLHKLADKNEINILGVIFSSNANKYGAGVCDAINTFYGRGDLPVGQYSGPVVVGDLRDSYNKAIATATGVYGHKLVDSATELVTMYKKLLKDQPDSSVTIVTVGHPVGLFYLMSDKEGKQLVEKKVLRWVAMTHTSEIPQNDWNFGKNGTAPYIAGLLRIWPTEIFFSGEGKEIITGNRKLPATGLNNPVRKAYELWGNNALENGRSSWDQIAVLYAARPHLFTAIPGKLDQNAGFETWWTDGSDLSRHYKIIPRLSREELEEMIEGLMSLPPRAK